MLQPFRSPSVPSRPHPAPAPVLIPILLLLVAAACGGGPGEPVAEAPAEVPEHTIEEFLDTTTLFGASFSPDGERILVSSDASGIFNAYAYPVDGGEPVQLTDSEDDSVFAYSYFPDDERFLYGSDRGGDERTHVYVREPDGTVADLTPGEGLKAQFLGWADDDASFFVATNERDQRYFDLYEVAVDGYEREEIYRNEEGYQFAAISPDERWIAFDKQRTTADSDVYLHDRESGETTHLTPHTGVVLNTAQAFTPSGDALLYLTDEGHEFRYLVRHDLAGGEEEVLLRPDWDVLYATFSDSGDHLVVAVNADARTDLRLFRWPGMERVELPELPQADIDAVTFSADDRRLAFYADSSRRPRNLYVHELGGDEPRRLTRNMSPAVDPEHLVDAEVVRFASYDGVEIPGLLYKPHRASAENPVPALVWVHGGPGGQSRIGYSALIQYLVNHGYGVYAINNRGSSGYGKTFFQMDDRRHGEADLGDCVASKAMLADTGWVDPERIGIMGGSYGGYMVLAALTLEPEEFAVGVDLFGISNWVRTLESIPPWWEAFREALYQELGDPEEDRERLRRISPLFHAERIQRPLMVLQGANDPRVLQAESDDIVEAARANGVPVEYVVFEDEGHGFVKKENREEGYRRIRLFLDRHLAGEAAEGDGTPAPADGGDAASGDGAAAGSAAGERAA